MHRENKAPLTLRSGYLLPELRREQNPSEAKLSSLSSTGLHPGYSAKEDKILLLLPFLISALIIFGHYSFLTRQNPEAHLAPAPAAKVENLKDEELAPVDPKTPFPNQVSGVVSPVPTSTAGLEAILGTAVQAKANLWLLEVGITLTENGSILIPQAAQSSRENLIRWAKKTTSAAHQAGLHTYLSLRFIEEPVIADRAKLLAELSQMISEWGKMAEEYHVAFFDPGITLGHPSFAAVPAGETQTLLKKLEQETRKYYTGRIGVGVCCRETNFNLRGYNQILVLGTDESSTKVLTGQAMQAAKRYGVEKVFFLDSQKQTVVSVR